MLFFKTVSEEYSSNVEDQQYPRLSYRPESF